MSWKNRIKLFIDSQHRMPQGLAGMYFGEKMVRQHKPETFWTIDQLNIAQGDRVLEIGCGAGYAIKLITAQYSNVQVTGVDLSPSVIRTAAIRNKRAAAGGKLQLFQADVTSMPLKDECVDKVFSIHTIYFWEDLNEAISEIFRVLKPGGSFVFTYSDGKDDETWENIKELAEEQLLLMMKEKGIVDLELVRGPKSRQYSTAAVMGKKKR